MSKYLKVKMRDTLLELRLLITESLSPPDPAFRNPLWLRFRAGLFLILVSDFSMNFNKGRLVFAAGVLLSEVSSSTHSSKT